MPSRETSSISKLGGGGGFKYFVFSPLPGEMILNCLYNIFQMGWFNHQLERAWHFIRPKIQLPKGHRLRPIAGRISWLLTDSMKDTSYTTPHGTQPKTPLLSDLSDESSCICCCTSQTSDVSCFPMVPYEFYGKYKKKSHSANGRPNSWQISIRIIKGETFIFMILWLSE